MEEGPVVWSADTQRIALDLVSAKTRDAVAAFLSPGYLASVVAEWSEAAGVRLTSPADTLASVSKALSYTDAQQDAIMAAFVSGGDVSAFGVAQAVTFVAGQLLDPDLSASMEDSAHEAMRLAAAHAR
jgi:precorrin-3B methylase